MDNPITAATDFIASIDERFRGTFTFYIALMVFGDEDPPLPFLRTAEQVEDVIGRLAETSGTSWAFSGRAIILREAIAYELEDRANATPEEFYDHLREVDPSLPDLELHRQTAIESAEYYRSILPYWQELKERHLSNETIRAYSRHLDAVYRARFQREHR